jgi:ribosome-binding protein aMBF1 (putative translation factor)
VWRFGEVPRGGQDKEPAMKSTKKARLVAAGWRVSDAVELLGLSDEERRFVELKLALAAGVRQLRERQGLTQAALARQLRSSQSRVARMEAADASVSLDLLMRSLLSIGATPRDIAKLIQKADAA